MIELSKQHTKMINGGAFKVMIRNIRTKQRDFISFRTLWEASNFVKNFNGRGRYIATLA